MRSDDVLLAVVRREAGRRVRRRRLVAGISTAVVVLAVGGGALALASGADQDSVSLTMSSPADGIHGAATTSSTTAADTTTSTSSTSSTSTTVVGPTSSVPASTTTIRASEPEFPPVVASARAEGIVVVVTAERDPDRPGWVGIGVRIRADHGSHPGGRVYWGDDTDQPYGLFADDIGPMDCGDLIDEDPTTNPTPDPGAGPVDESFRLDHSHDPGSIIEIRVHGSVSWCTSDHVHADVVLMLTLP